MTRKRFCKLLMARGYSRNEVNRMAASYNLLGWTYADAYESRVKWDNLKNAIDKVSAACCEVGKAIMSAAESIVKYMSAAKFIGNQEIED